MILEQGLYGEIDKGARGAGIFDLSLLVDDEDFREKSNAVFLGYLLVWIAQVPPRDGAICNECAKGGGVVLVDTQDQRIFSS